MENEHLPGAAEGGLSAFQGQYSNRINFMLDKIHLVC